MASNKRNLKAYVRYDGTGRVIAGSLILQAFKPKVGNWKEIDAYECCNYNPTPVIACGAPYWINTEYKGTISSSNFTNMQSQFVDSNCNVYTVGYENGDSENVVVSKYAPDGSSIWVKNYKSPLVEGVGFYYGVNNMHVDASGNVYVSCPNAIFKLDSSGNMLWENNFGSSHSNCAIIADNNYVFLVTDSSLAGRDMLIGKFNASTGALVDEKRLSITDTDRGIYSNSRALLDSEGNLIVAINYFKLSSVAYVTALFKTDVNLNVIWVKTIGPFSSDNDSIGIRLDANDNIYGNGYYRNFYKVDKNGNLLWVIQSPQSWAEMGVSSTGDLYVAREYLVSGKRELQYVKFDPSGVQQWSTGISATSLSIRESGWGANVNDGGFIKDDVLLWITRNNIVSTSNFVGGAIKLSLDQTLGTYGIYTLTDSTGTWSFTTLSNASSVPAYTLVPSSLIDIVSTTLGTLVPYNQVNTLTNI